MIPKQELQKIKGGGWLQVAGIVGGVLTFLIGMFEGIIKPLTCND